jgi:hypothetical protein
MSSRNILLTFELRQFNSRSGLVKQNLLICVAATAVVFEMLSLWRCHSSLTLPRFGRLNLVVDIAGRDVGYSPRLCPQGLTPVTNWTTLTELFIAFIQFHFSLTQQY